jgi:hypothetical protein
MRSEHGIQSSPIVPFALRSMWKDGRASRRNMHRRKKLRGRLVLGDGAVRDLRMVEGLE